MEESAVAGDLELGTLLEQMGSEQGVDQAYLRSTSLPQELAAETGMDPDTAEEALHQVLAMLAVQPQKPAGKKPKSSATSKPKPKTAAKTQPKSSATKSKPRSTSKTQSGGTAKSKSKPKTTGRTPSRSTSVEGIEAAKGKPTPE
jgi:hypothetical protein